MTRDVARAGSTPPGESTRSDVRREATSVARAHSYVVPGDALEFGASLGNAHCWLTTHGNGSIQDIFSTDIGATIANTIAVRYGGTGHHLLRASGHTTVTNSGADDVQLWPVTPGTIELHPAYQQRIFALPEDIHVQETVFVPYATGDDPAVAYYHVAVTNRGAETRAVRVFAFGRLCGTLGQDVAARYEPDLRALVVANRGQPERVRVFGCTAPVAAYETTHDFGHAYDVLHARTLSNETHAEGDVLAALQVDLVLAPDETRALAFVLAFAPTGDECDQNPWRDRSAYAASAKTHISTVSETGLAVP